MSPLVRSGSKAPAWTSAQVLREIERQECERSLLAFVVRMWPVVEPQTELVLGTVLEAVCEHLEAVTRGDIVRLLINVPPGSMKSLLTDVFWPAWEWTTRPWLRYVAFSYSASLTERDNRKFLALVSSPVYRELWGPAGRGKARFALVKQGETLVSNSVMGSKLATSVGGVGTGERGDRVIIDDPHNVKEAESEAVRTSTVEWFANAASNRLNDIKRSSIVIIMQRVHEEDVSGFVLSKGLGYTHLMIPAEFEQGRVIENDLGWSDWRSEEGESFWPDRYPPDVLATIKRTQTPFAYAGQYQQRPEPKGGGIIKSDWWRPWFGKEYPIFDYTVASLDTAYGQKQENDLSALTIWGFYTDGQGVPRALLCYAWQDRVPLHELAETVAKHCTTLRVDRLLIENKASGISLGQEMHRLYGDASWGVQMINPGAQDKTARLHSVAHLFWEGLIEAPWKREKDGYEAPMRWAEMVIHQSATFPRGAHDDLVDSAVQALRHGRDMGCLTRGAERRAEADEAARQQPETKKLYPGT